MFTVAGKPYGLGALLALVILIIVLILAVSGHELTRDWDLALLGGLALAILLP